MPEGDEAARADARVGAQPPPPTLSGTRLPRPAGAPGEQVVAPRRRGGTALDMVRSLGLMAVVVGFLLLFFLYLLKPGSSSLYPRVGYGADVTGFHQLTGRTALSPRDLPSSWRATSASLSGTHDAAHLHVGFGVDGKTYAGLEEGNGPALLTTVLGARGAAASSGTTVVGGASWSLRRAADGEPALTRVVAGVTVVVTGSADSADLRLLAASLHPAP